MTREQLKILLQNDYISKTGKAKLRKMPEDIKDIVIKETSFYKYQEYQHLGLRCYFIINDIYEVKKCPECNTEIHPISLQKYKTQNFCSLSCSTKNKDVLEKSKQTNLEKYGVEYVTQHPETIKKQQATNLEKYGVQSVLQHKDIIKKKITTTISRHGIVSCFQNNEIQDKIKKANIEKYGVEYPLQYGSILNKTKISMKEKYGTEHAGLCHIGKENIKILDDKEKFSKIIDGKTLTEISSQINIKCKSSILKIIKKYELDDLYQKKSPSYLEHEMQEFLDENNISYETNNRTILNGRELDFYIPDYNMAIEMNGVYWHSDKFKCDKYYHYDKWKMCNEQGIHLISIFEDDWNFQNIKIKNMLLNFFGKKPKGIPARKTIINKIDGIIARHFLDQYHLQGYVIGTHYGAFDNTDNLIGVMTFGTTRNGRFELKRFVTDNYIHSGLFSKMFNYAQSDLQFNEVVSFSDNTCFTGNVYKTNKFTLVKVIPPDYRYLFNNKRTHKSNFKKSNIKVKFPELCESIDNGMTETQAMELLGIPKIYDCGKCEWIWSNTDK
jgi:hypothetical protein